MTKDPRPLYDIGHHETAGALAKVLYHSFWEEQNGFTLLATPNTTHPEDFELGRRVQIELDRLKKANEILHQTYESGPSGVVTRPALAEWIAAGYASQTNGFITCLPYGSEQNVPFRFTTLALIGSQLGKHRIDATEIVLFQDTLKTKLGIFVPIIFGSLTTTPQA